MRILCLLINKVLAIACIPEQMQYGLSYVKHIFNQSKQQKQNLSMVQVAGYHLIISITLFELNTNNQAHL